jgi:L-iditol 2-dehydrogenase
MGPGNFCLEDLPMPPAPQSGEVVIRVGAVGVCGSDLHTYSDGRIGDTVVKEPLVMGHEFAGTVETVGPDALDGLHNPLVSGQRVAVEPGLPCWHCDRCEQGHPNLCRNLRFMGLWPEPGALQEYLVVPSRNCFPIPDHFTMDEGAMLEPLGVAIHAVDLGKIRAAQSVVVLGCGPIGLLIIRLAKLSGAMPVLAFDRFDWRLDAAKQFGADAVFNATTTDPVSVVQLANQGHGASVVFEAAWAEETVGQAVEIADLGARVVLVGIPGDDHAGFKHSTARRKGLTIMMCRRMKHTYPRAILLAESQPSMLQNLVTHHFDLAQTGDAYALNAAYGDAVIKAMITLG